MSKILAALDRNNRERGGMPDNVMASFTDSLGRAASEKEAALKDAKELRSRLATTTTERDRLQAEVHRFASVNTELGELRERCRTLEETLKQKNAAILLEQSTLKRISSDSNSSLVAANQRVDTLQTQLSAEQAKCAKLDGQLSERKNQRPAAAAQVIQQAPVDYSGMEFSIGSVVRGPDGIQGARIKLVKSN